MLSIPLNKIQRKPLPRLLGLFARGPVASPATVNTVADAVAAPAVAPDVSMYAPDGSGRLTVAYGGFAPGQAGVGLTFIYTVPAGGLWLGELTVTVPDGWSPPTAAEGWDRGSVTASTGTVSVSGPTIRVADITLDPGRTVTITYSNVTVGRLRGRICFAAQQRSTRYGTLTSLAASPSVMVGSPGH